MPNQRDISEVNFSNIKPVLRSEQTVIAADYTAAQNITTLETYLLANGYTQATLDKMTKNDKVLAYRVKKGSALAPR